MSEYITTAQKIDELLGLEINPSDIVSTKPAAVTNTGDSGRDMDYDFAVARKTIHHVMEKGNELVDDATFFAKEKQDARSTEAAAMALKEARDNALALITLHKTRQEIFRISNISTGSGDTNIQNNTVFVGTTADLLRHVKEMNADGMLKKALTTIDVNIDE